MSGNPVNQLLRFVLEILALAAFAFWGWAWGSPWKWPLAIGLPILVAIVWAAFVTPGDPSRGKDGWVAVPGWFRLLLELTIFGLAVAALLNAHSNDNATYLAAILAAGVIIHYALSWDRIRWLLGRNGA